MVTRNIVLFGPPGAGKGVQSQRLIARYPLAHIAPGNVFREEIAQRTPLGRSVQAYIDEGHLVPERMVIELVSRHLAWQQPTHGILFDGYPRSLEQANALEEQLAAIQRALDLVLLLDVPPQEATQRLAIRQQVADRADDTTAKAAHRLELYEAYAPPIIAYYRKRHRLVAIDGVGTIDSIHQQIAKAIEALPTPPTRP